MRRYHGFFADSARWERFTLRSGDVIITTTTRSEQTSRGLAIYRFGASEPIPLDRALPLLNEPGLEHLHLGRIAHTRGKQKLRARWSRWLWWGAGIVVGGAVVTMTGLAADSSGLKAGGLVTMGIGLPVELIGAIGMWSNTSTAQEQAYANLRSVLLLPGEDDLAAAERGVVRYNDRARGRCGR